MFFRLPALGHFHFLLDFFKVSNHNIYRETRSGSLLRLGLSDSESPCFLKGMIMKKRRAIAYIDGFNLFYSSLKGTPHKWLDLVSLCESFLKQNDELIAVKYFSAIVSSFGNDSGRSDRQRIYLEALQTNPKIEIQLGHFSVHKTRMPLAADWKRGKIVLAEVIKTEEKGTDVNLAVQMTADAKDSLFDYALLFSNDSDMAHSVKIVHNDCGKQVGLFIDNKSTTIKTLKENVLHIKRLSQAKFAEHQLPEKIITATGRTITKPKVW